MTKQALPKQLQKYIFHKNSTLRRYHGLGYPLNCPNKLLQIQLYNPNIKVVLQ